MCVCLCVSVEHWMWDLPSYTFSSAQCHVANSRHHVEQQTSTIHLFCTIVEAISLCPAVPFPVTGYSHHRDDQPPLSLSYLAQFHQGYNAFAHVCYFPNKLILTHFWSSGFCSLPTPQPLPSGWCRSTVFRASNPLLSGIEFVPLFLPTVHYAAVNQHASLQIWAIA